MTTSIIQGDALERLRELPSDHFHCVVTSPPYWGLRDYGVDGQIGLEETPDAWCARLVEVFREVRRVLRPDGVCFVNIGDSYASAPAGLKPKDLVGQPWMLAFALRADGWWLRGDYIWAKPNPMPESVRDRCTKAHEYMFHLSKSERYFWDAEAVREPHNDLAGPPSRFGNIGANGGYRGSESPDGLARGNMPKRPGACEYNPAGRNLRSVWTIATEPLPSITVDGEKLDHFASYPIELARRCILAGTSAKGCCPECGAPWARVVERTLQPPGPRTFNKPTRGQDSKASTIGWNGSGSAEWAEHGPIFATTGWRPTCYCGDVLDWAPDPCRVLDPFGGSGRTALAAEELGRDCTLIELNPASVRMAQAQIERAKARRFIGYDVTREPPDPRQGALL